MFDCSPLLPHGRPFIVHLREPGLVCVSLISERVSGCPPVDSAALGISSDGSSAVGYGNGASGFEAMRWRSAGGMIGLGVLGGTNGSEAHGTNADGSVVVGLSDSSSGTQAFRWTSGGGMVGL